MEENRNQVEYVFEVATTPALADLVSHNPADRHPGGEDLRFGEGVAILFAGRAGNPDPKISIMIRFSRGLAVPQHRSSQMQNKQTCCTELGESVHRPFRVGIGSNAPGVLFAICPADQEPFFSTAYELIRFISSVLPGSFPETFCTC